MEKWLFDFFSLEWVGTMGIYWTEFFFPSVKLFGLENFTKADVPNGGSNM